MSRVPKGDALATVRKILLALLGLGMLGTAADLLLMDHHEDAWQLIPLVAIGLALGVLAWHAVDSRPASVRALQVMMVLFIGAGAGGIVLHFRGNREFQLEIDPSLQGPELFWSVMKAKAPPALAPGIMVQLGLLGLACTYRHPAVSPSSNETTGSPT
jgi:hypothetical protein